MLKQSLLVALLVGLFAIPALAADKAVPKSTLKKAGLASLQPISEKQGLEVRGQGGAALTMGMSFVSGMLMDPKTKSFVYGVDVNNAQAFLDTSFIGMIDPNHMTQSGISLGLDLTDIFKGMLIGGAGGGASALVH